MLEQYSDKFNSIYEAVPEGKIFRLVFDPVTKCFRLICKDNSALDEIRKAFSAKNEAAFFTERYGYKSEEFVYAINKFGFFSTGLLFEVLQWIKDTYGSASPLAMSQNCRQYITDYLIPLKSSLKEEFAVSNISEDVGRNAELRRMRQKQFDAGTPEKKCVHPFEFRDYQEEAVKRLLFSGYGRGVIEVPTAGGKSFIIANFIWNVLKNIDRNAKTLILVPSTQLVAQFYNDLIDYGYDQRDIAKFTGSLSGKEKKHNDIKSAKIVVANRQYVFKNKDKLPRFNVLFADECLVGNTNILTINGNKKIKDITTDDIVLSFNEKTKTYEYKPVIQVHKNLYSSNCYDELISITTDNGNKILVTPNHKIYTLNRGYVRADELTLNDDLISY